MATQSNDDDDQSSEIDVLAGLKGMFSTIDQLIKTELADIRDNFGGTRSTIKEEVRQSEDDFPIKSEQPICKRDDETASSLGMHSWFQSALADDHPPAEFPPPIPSTIRFSKQRSDNSSVVAVGGDKSRQYQGSSKFGRFKRNQNKIREERMEQARESRQSTEGSTSSRSTEMRTPAETPLPSTGKAVELDYDLYELHQSNSQYMPTMTFDKSTASKVSNYSQTSPHRQASTIRFGGKAESCTTASTGGILKKNRGHGDSSFTSAKVRPPPRISIVNRAGGKKHIYLPLRGSNVSLAQQRSVSSVSTNRWRPSPGKQPTLWGQYVPHRSSKRQAPHVADPYHLCGKSRSQCGTTSIVASTTERDVGNEREKREKAPNDRLQHRKRDLADSSQATPRRSSGSRREPCETSPKSSRRSHVSKREPCETSQSSSKRSSPSKGRSALRSSFRQARPSSSNAAEPSHAQLRDRDESTIPSSQPQKKSVRWNLPGSKRGGTNKGLFSSLFGRSDKN